MSEKTYVRVMMRDILDVVCRHFQREAGDIRSARRTPGIVEPRHWFCWLATQMTPNSLPEIGRFINRDHPSVMHARDKIAAMVAKGGADARLAQELRAAATLLAQTRRPDAALPVEDEPEPETAREIASRIVRGGMRAAVNASVHDVLTLSRAVLAEAPPTFCDETQEETSAHG